MIASDLVQWGCEQILKKERWRLKYVLKKDSMQLGSDKSIYKISKLTIIFGFVEIYWWFRIEFKKSRCKIYNLLVVKRRIF